MIKADIINKVQQRTEVAGKTISLVIDTFLDEIAAALVRREEVELRGFGKFVVKHLKERPARDLKRGTKIIVPAKDTPAFKASKTLKDKI